MANSQRQAVITLIEKKKKKKQVKTVRLWEGPEGGRGVPIPFPSPFFFPNPTSQCSNTIPTTGNPGSLFVSRTGFI